MLRVLHPAGSDAAMWQACADKLALDVTLTPAYARVQEIATGARAICLLYCWRDRFLMLPGLLHQNDAGFDMASFFGGGGPAGNGIAWDAADSAFDVWRTENNVVCEYAQSRAMAIMPGPHGTEVKRAVVVDLANRTDAQIIDSFSRNRQRSIKDIGREANRVPLTREWLYSFHSLYEQSLDRLDAARRWRYPKRAWGAYARELRDEHMMLVADGSTAMLLVALAYGKAHAMFMASSEGGQDMHSMLYWRAMCLAREAGCHTFYLGGGRTNAPDDALLAYKLSFSKHTVPVYEYRRIFDQVAYKSLAQSKDTSFFPPWRAAA